MPYIRAERRLILEDRVRELGLREAGQSVQAPGELSYLISQVIAGHLAVKGKSFTVYAGIVGALVLLILELWSRFIGPYEVSKKKENGGVW